ncbi:MAG: hypothetical protein IT430_17295 [Phycisphaerales bacterium]|nr:hypothetical protein [Phycisphaerales bacterium]
MKLYIASHSQIRARELKSLLENRGYVIVARWITCDSKFGHGAQAYTDDERRDLTVMDEEDVRAADALVLIAEEPGHYVPGGKHVETGIAIALGRPVVVVGQRENIFHWHPLVTQVSSFEGVVSTLERFRSAGPVQDERGRATFSTRG